MEQRNDGETLSNQMWKPLAWTVDGMSCAKIGRNGGSFAVKE